MPASVAVQNVTVIPMDAERRLEAHSVVVRDGRIAWMGAASDEPRLPPDTRRVDGRGKFLMPGIADMHVHVGREDDLALYVAYGITTIRNMWGLPRHIRWRDAVARGELLGPTIRTVSPIIDGVPTRRPGARPIVSADDAERAVADARRAGYIAMKVYDHIAPRQYRMLHEAAARHGLPVVGHVPFRVGLEAVLAAGQRSIEHLSGHVEAAQPPGSPLRARDADPTRALRLLVDGLGHVDRGRLFELADREREAGVWNAPTLMVRRRWTQTVEELVARPEMRYVPRPQLAAWSGFRKLGVVTPDQASQQVSVYREIAELLWRRTGRMLVGTDTPIHFQVPGATTHEELAELAAAGLRPHEILLCATAKAAEFLGELQEWGTVSVGKRADLVLLDRDPLIDVSNARLVAGVCLRGEWISGGELRARLDAIAERAGRVEPGVAAAEPGAATRSGGRRYQIAVGGRIRGDEELRVERGTGGRLVVDGTTHIAVALGRGWEPGTYETRLAMTASDADMRATLVSVTVDGRSAVELAREGREVRARTTHEVLGSAEEDRTASPDALVGRLLPAFFVCLGARLAMLREGERARLEVIGPGMPPDDVILTTTIDVERLKAHAPGRAYELLATRDNGVYSGTLRFDGAGDLMEARLYGPSVSRAHDAAEERSRLRNSEPIVITAVQAEKPLLNLDQGVS